MRTLNALPFIQTTQKPIPQVVKQLLAHFVELWWQTGATQPGLGRVYSIREQLDRERQIASFLDKMLAELKKPAFGSSSEKAAEAAADLRQRFLPSAALLAQDVLGLEESQIGVILNNGFIEQTEAFARMARDFDPAISTQDIYQASRNVWTMNFFQLLLGLPVQVTPAVFAFSMLYPYSDNYLDDPSVSNEAKAAFNERFFQRICGSHAHPATAQEASISELVGMIETQYDRQRWPRVYDSLLALHQAQTRSIRLLSSPRSASKAKISPYEVDVLGICFEKGGTSGLADGYLVAGALSEEQEAFTFLYGIFTQLIDDLEDVKSDLAADLTTVFSGTARHWSLESVTNRTLHLGNRLVEALAIFESPIRQPFSELLEVCLPVLIMTSAAGARKYYPPSYIRQLETHMPVSFSFLDHQRKKLEKHKASLSRLWS